MTFACRRRYHDEVGGSILRNAYIKIFAIRQLLGQLGRTYGVDCYSYTSAADMWRNLADSAIRETTRDDLQQGGV
jgi:hypothetical protein